MDGCPRTFTVQQQQEDVQQQQEDVQHLEEDLHGPAAEKIGMVIGELEEDPTQRKTRLPHEEAHSSPNPFEPELQGFSIWGLAPSQLGWKVNNRSNSNTSSYRCSPPPLPSTVAALHHRCPPPSLLSTTAAFHRCSPSSLLSTVAALPPLPSTTAALHHRCPLPPFSPPPLPSTTVLSTTFLRLGTFLLQI
ncbi:hypothetical protein LR48_Vigan01g070100 [Vigna angularis]|uniref:Uncharacterized protein n=1 Tax=Phaseolus angularis TaxID=3914 RepID=A0A0L9TKZ2_PHAAN|nr:hypothetical protein LR48_Vigan01g070100 [Vigna angularis]